MLVKENNESKNHNEEIEVKIKINDRQTNENLLSWLNANAEFQDKISQEEYYLDNPNSSWFIRHAMGYKHALKYLRVRFTKNGDWVCFKNWETGKVAGEAGLFCKDIEYKVSCGNQALLLFKSLGFTDVTKFHKLREVYCYNGIEISVDSVEGLGVFFEFELKDRESDNQDKEYQRLINFIENDLKISNYKIQKQGFIVLLWNRGFNFGD